MFELNVVYSGLELRTMCPKFGSGTYVDYMVGKSLRDGVIKDDSEYVIHVDGNGRVYLEDKGSTRKCVDLMKKYSALLVNHASRDELEKVQSEYDASLPTVEMLASWLVQETGLNVDRILWDTEKMDICHIWSGKVHARYLKKATELLDIEPDANKIKRLISLALSRE